ncbi:MAG: SGNH/GDSL hydrolase family protein [Silicimonas sp.]|nr:SGNH/GDSL hydrolase family protein [Silicimonas sp.]
MKSVLFAAGIGAFVASSPVSATTIDNIFAFGDSLNDCCRNPGAPFTNGPQTWLPDFAAAVGGRYAEDMSFNYAVGGAQTGPVNAVGQTDAGLGYPTGFTSQAERFKDAAPATGAQDLGVIWVGTNDIWATAYENDLLFGAVPYNRPIGKQPEADVFVDYAINTLRGGIDDLVAGGIEKLLILTPYDMASSALWDTPEAQTLSREYSLGLRDALSTIYTPGVDTWVLDMVATLEKAQGVFPFGTGFEPCPTPDTETGCDDHIFNDFVHLTTAMNKIVSDEAAALVTTAPPVAPVPLPSGFLFFLTGVSSLIFLRRRTEAKAPVT